MLLFDAFLKNCVLTHEKLFLVGLRFVLLVHTDAYCGNAEASVRLSVTAISRYIQFRRIIHIRAMADTSRKQGANHKPYAIRWLACGVASGFLCVRSVCVDRRRSSSNALFCCRFSALDAVGVAQRSCARSLCDRSLPIRVSFSLCVYVSELA